MTSLSPPADPLPSLPTTPDYNRASPESAPSVRSFGPAMSIESEKSKRNIFKFSSIAKRNKSTKNLIETEVPQPPQEDEGISGPWNFQHHIHVDEGFVGLPPSWSNALSQAGFTDDEIAAIHARRTAARGNPNTSRPDSPLSILRHPAPRSSSLAAHSSNATLLASAYINAPSPTSFPPSRQSSYTATSSSHSNSVAEGDTVDTQYVFVNGAGHESMIDPYPLDTHSVSTHHSSSNHTNSPQITRVQSEAPPRSNSRHTPSPLVHSHSLPLNNHSIDAHSLHSATPRTPPRRVFHVSNADESPPPAYHSPVHTPVFRDKLGLLSEGSRSGIETESEPLREKERDMNSFLDISATANTTSSSFYTDTDTNLSLPDIDHALLNRHLTPTPPLVIDKRMSKVGALPPRLSFHLSSDLGFEDWGAGLLGGLEDGSGSGGGGNGSRLDDRLGLAKPGRFVESKRKNLLVDRGEGSSSLVLPGFSFPSSSSSPLLPSPSTSTSTSRSPSTSSRPSSPSSLKSQSLSHSTAISTPSTSPSPSAPSHSPSELIQPTSSVLSPSTSSLLSPPSSNMLTPTQLTSNMLSPTPTQTLPTVPDVSFGADITLGAPLRVMVPGSPAPGRSTSPTPTTRTTSPPTTTKTPLIPTRITPHTPTRELPVPPEEVEVDRSIDPVLPDISLGPNVSSLGAGLNLSSLGIGSDALSLNTGRPKISSSSTQISSTDHTDLIKPSSPRACRLGIEVTVASQSPTSATLSSKNSDVDSSRGEGIGALMAGGRDSPSMTSSPTTGASTTSNHSLPLITSPSSSTTLLPLRPAGDRNSEMSVMTVTPATIVSVSGAVAITLATASVVDSDSVSLSAVEPADDAGSETEDGASVVLDSDGVSITLDSNPAWPEPPLTPDLDTTPRQPTRFRATSLRVQGSPHSSHFSCETGSTTESPPLITPKLHVPPSPLRDKSFAPEAALLTSTTDTFGVGGRDDDSDEGFTLPLPKAHTQSQLQRLPEWIADAVSFLSEFMVDVDPQECFADLQEIAEGESGSVYAARLVCPPDTHSLPPGTTHVAIKAITIHPAVSPKLQDLSHEMELMRGVHHEHVLRMDAFYVNLVDDSVWIRMELMERSLADVIGLVGEGLSLQERMIARFASDVLLALEYLQKHHIAHRDVRSDNLLLNASGIVKVADFSNAVRVTRNSPMCVGAVGVIYWQAPEMRVGTYNALKVDVWSLGATVWELAQTEPPFADVQDPRQIGVQWPPLRQPELYSRRFHEFLKLCSRPYASRPNANELVNTPFIRNACGRAVNVQLLSQCRAIEEHVLQRESESGGDS